jgi:hypothetical protein
VPLRTAFCRGEAPKNVSYPFKTTWHQLCEDEHIWTTDLPCEIEQQAKLLEGMEGAVLVGGLGIGLVPTLLGQNPAVKRIDVVERSQDVVNLVAPHLNTGDAKLTVHTCELFDFLRTKAENEIYDYALFDIWRHDGEWTLYKTVWPLRRLARKLGIDDSQIVNWNEDVMVGQVWNGLRSLVEMTHRSQNAELQAAVEAVGSLEWIEKFAITAERAEKAECPPLQRWFWKTYYREQFNQRPMEEVTKLVQEYVGNFGFEWWEKRFGVQESDVPVEIK